MVSILSADDDPGIQMLYRTILGKRDYDVRICSSGQEAIDSFAERAANIVLLDMEMPGLSGLETCKQLRQTPGGGKVPILMVSSKDSEESIVQALSTGADDYILKPFKATEILAKVTYALRKRSAGFQGDVALNYTDRYEIVKKIDEGGTTTVYLAQDVSKTPPLKVALKIFQPPDTPKGAEFFKTLFLREAYEWSKLNHPNIVKLHDFGQTAGSHFLVLEFIDGETLWDRVEEGGTLNERDLLTLAHELTLALEYITKFGLIHRDIKPNNILISRTGDVKLTDFGLAKQPEDTQITVMHDVFKGTPDFVSPEQIGGKEILDIRSDVYSLGATLYYAATRSLPFRSDSLIGTLHNHFRIIPPPIRTVNSTYGQAASDMIARMLAKEKNDRYGISELRIALESLLSVTNG